MQQQNTCHARNFALQSRCQMLERNMEKSRGDLLSHVCIELCDLVAWLRKQITCTAYTVAEFRQFSVLSPTEETNKSHTPNPSDTRPFLRCAHAEARRNRLGCMPIVRLSCPSFRCSCPYSASRRAFHLFATGCSTTYTIPCRATMQARRACRPLENLRIIVCIRLLLLV